MKTTWEGKRTVEDRLDMRIRCVFFRLPTPPVYDLFPKEIYDTGMRSLNAVNIQVWFGATGCTGVKPISDPQAGTGLRIVAPIGTQGTTVAPAHAGKAAQGLHPACGPLLTLMAI